MMLRARKPLELVSSLLFASGVAAACGMLGCASDAAPGDALDVSRAAVITRTDDVDCPPGIPCDEVPAAYAISDMKTGAYGNYDIADREHDGMDIRYIVIHTTEGSYDGTIAVFQDPKYGASAHYLVRSRDGNLAKLISPDHVAWHAGNWYFNMHSVGIEHEANSPEGQIWFTDALYETSAALVRFLAQKYNIPLDRQHIIGHDEVPGLSQARTPGMHWDPGPYWDWDRFMRMLRPRGGEAVGDRRDDGSETVGPVRILPDYATNRPVVSYCYGTGSTDCHEAPSQQSNFLYLYQGPSKDSPLLVNRYLSTTPGDRMYNWGNKLGTGRLYYRIESSGDWDAIYFDGQAAWFHNPGRIYTRIPLLSSHQVVITPKVGGGTIAVYGGAYPGDAAYKLPTTPQHLEKIYDLPEGQRYIAEGPITADYYWAKVWAATLPMSSNQLVKDSTPFYVLSFNHRLALVRADDVTVVKTTGGHGADLERRESLRLLDRAEKDSGIGIPDATAEMPLCDLKGME